MSPNSWQTSLQQWATRQPRPPKLAILGIGNTLQGDDAAGVLIARRLARSRLTHQVDSLLVIDAGPAPENTTARIRRFAPEVVILIDAAEMGEMPGTIRWIELDEIDGMDASTHTLPLSLLAWYLTLELGCEVRFLGIQMQSNEFEVCVSRNVLQAADEIVEGLTRLIASMRTPENVI